MALAVLVIDMQNGFLHPQGSLPRAGIRVAEPGRVIDENRALISAARDMGLPILYTRHVHRPDLIDVPHRHRAAWPADLRPLVRGTWDADIIDELTPADAELVVEKPRYDAFLYTDLELVLRSLGVRELLVAGIVTSVCVESTVRAGEQRGFAMSVAADCCAGPAPLHEASLSVMARWFAHVAPWRELLRLGTEEKEPVGLLGS